MATCWQRSGGLTCIIGIITGPRVVVAGDSCVSWAESVMLTGDPKIWRVGSAIVGIAGDIRLMNALELDMKVQPPPKRGNFRRWMAREFAPAVAEALEELPGKKHHLNVLVAYRNQIATMDGTLGFNLSGDGYAAIGSGMAHALAALAATQDMTDPEERVMRVLAAVERHCPSVRAPFTVLST